jgi:PAS domain-containing protein
VNDTDPGVQLDALRHREALLEAGQELAGLVTLEWYVDEDRIEWSRSPEFLLGPKPPGGYPVVREMVHPDDRDDWLAQRARALQSECPGAYEYRLVRTDGALRWVAHVQRTSKSVDGRPTLVTVTMLDVTARRTSQDEATRLLRDAVENLEESFSLCDPEGRYVVTNRRFRENNAEIAGHVRIGCRYEDAVRAGVAKGLYPDAIGNEEK